MFDALLSGVLVSLVAGLLLLRYRSLLGRLAEDSPNSGPQKFHLAPTPRIGGIPVLLAAAVAALFIRELDAFTFEFSALLVFCALFAFAGGLAEDLTKSVSIRLRLLMTLVSAALAFVYLDARITRLDLPGFDWALSIPAFSFAFTLLAVAGFAQATNIVDGFNGLAGVVSLIFLGAVAAVAHIVGDEPLVRTSLLIGAGIVGFLVLNFPRGHIFLGDGGAYMVGFIVAELVVLLVHRNSEVSPWFALAVLAYPVVEVLFSVYRKRVLRGQSASHPDGLHLHMLIHKRLVRRYVKKGGSDPDLWANPLTSPFLWALSLLTALPAVVFWNRTTVLQVVVVAFAIIYVWLYWAIVRFRSPRFLRLRTLRPLVGVEVTPPSVTPIDGAVAEMQARPPLHHRKR